jgi:threonine/homoserine/homoserine lactone efflux protein
MLPLQTIIPFFGIAVVLGLAPGPDNLFVLLQSAMRGVRAGMVVVLGLCTGLLVHTAAVAFGLAGLFAASHVAFAALKIIGALYLAYLAWQAFRAPADMVASGSTESVALGQMYRRGIVMNLTNPKVVIFFLAFLPQFVVPDHGRIALQILMLGAIFVIATLLVFSAVAWGSGTFGALLLGSARARRGLNWFAGLVFLGLALRLATSHM